jgi:hypothetical protein
MFFGLNGMEARFGVANVIKAGFVIGGNADSFDNTLPNSFRRKLVM